MVDVDGVGTSRNHGVILVDLFSVFSVQRFPSALPGAPAICYTHPDVPKQMAAVSNQWDGEVGCYSLILLLFQHVCTCNQR